MAPSEVDHVNSHATSTPAGDRLEAMTLASVFGNPEYQSLDELESREEGVEIDLDHPYDETRLSEISVWAPKGHIGHTFAAAGGIEIVLGLKSMQEGKIPNILNLKNPVIQGKGLNFIKDKPIEQQINCMVKTSLAFGGNNSSYNNRNSDSHPGSQTTSPTRPRGRGYRGNDRDSTREGYLKRVTVKEFDAEGKEIYREDHDYGEPGYDDQGYYGNSYDNQGYYGDGENFPMPEVE